MSQEVAARLGSLTQDHREGRLSLRAYRNLRAPLLDMLVTHKDAPPAAARAEPAATWASNDGDPAVTTRPRSPAHAVGTGVATVPIASAPRELPAAGLASRPKRIHPMTLGLTLLAVTGAVIATSMIWSTRKPSSDQLAAAYPKPPERRRAASPEPPAVQAAAPREPSPAPAANTTAREPQAASCDSRSAVKAPGGLFTCRDKLVTGDFGPPLVVTSLSSPPGALSFAISVQPITQAQFRAFCKQTSRRFPRQPWDEDEDPVVNVTWDEAREYLMWLSSISGKRYRLPTEEDWLTAARLSGNEPRPRTGKVREWMADVPASEADPRWVRGISYADPAAELLTARRARDASTRDALTGFRALREIP